MPRPPRTVFLTDIVTPYMVAVLGALARRVDLKAIFAAHRGSRGLGWEFGERLPFRYRVLDGWSITRRDGADLYPTPRTLGALIAERPEAIISGAFSFSTAWAGVYCRATGARLLIHSDGTSHSELGFNRIQLTAREILLRQATACVGNSQPAVERFIELGAAPARVFRAPHSTDIAPFQTVALERRDPQPQHAGGRVTVLHVGRLIPRKGIDRLMHAVAAASSRVRIRLLLVGDGPEEQALRRLAADLGIAGAVELRGFVDQPALPAVYREADVFAFPTLSDPFGIVLLEAAAAGLPIIASPHAGATLDVLDHERSGLVVDPDDIGAWTSALVTLGRDPALRRRLGDAANAATLHRTPEHTAAGYTEALDAAMRLPAGVIPRRRRA